MSNDAGHKLLAFGDFVFDPVARELRRHGTVVKVEAKQLQLLECLLLAGGKLVSRQELIDQVWEGRALAESAVSVTVAKLRKLLGHAPGRLEHIENRYGRGYRFLLPITALDMPQTSAPAALHSASSTPFVGRADSLQRLEAALLRARAGHGSLCLLSGEPGIGKTRTAEVLEHMARAQGVRVAWGRCHAAGGAPPLWPFAQVLRELGESALADRLLGAAEQTPGASAWRRGFSADAVASSHRTSDEIARALQRASQTAPLLILLDDLHWADAATLRVLTYLAEDLARAPIAVVAMQRRAEPQPEGGAPELSRVLGLRHAESIELARLAEDETTDYVRAVFDSADAELGRAVFSRSEGNPFFMVELLRPFIGAQAPRPEQLRLSALALDLVRQRLRNLPDTTHDVLGAAAVIGRNFDLALLSRVSEREPGELLDALDDSLANETVIASAEVPGAYAFDHDLIREVSYASLPTTVRCRLHLRAGLALAERSAAGDAIPSAELAHHFLAAVPHGDVALAVEHAREAAAAAYRACAHGDAVALLRRALEATKLWPQPNPHVLTELLLELAMVERVLGDGLYVEHLRRGVALAREHRLGPQLAAAGQLLSPSPGILARADACSVLEAAVQVLPEAEAGHRATTLVHLAWTPPYCESARKVDALLAEAEALVQRSRDRHAAFTLKEAQLYFTAGTGDYAHAARLADAIDREQTEHPELAQQGRALITPTLRLIHALQRGDAPGLERALEQRRAALGKIRNIELDWHQERLLVVLRMNRGEFAGVLEDLTELRERAQRLQLQAWPALWARDYGALLTWTADVREVAQRVRSGLIPTESDSPATRARKLATLVEYGLCEDARGPFAQLTQQWLRDLPRDREYLATLANLAQTSAAAGSTAQCRTLYELLSPHAAYFAVGISFHNEGPISHWLGRLARALGEPAQAARHFEAALQLSAASEQRAYTLASQFELASTLLELGDVSATRRAKELLEATLPAAERLGLRPLVQRVQLRIAAANT
ncbi:MAG TPA: AAA family ATPase [Polyangiales bacterium]|nr:AAA family ATPase [Polyangiales bacterium]